MNFWILALRIVLMGIMCIFNSKMNKSLMRHIPNCFVLIANDPHDFATGRKGTRKVGKIARHLGAVIEVENDEVHEGSIDDREEKVK